MLYIKKSKKVTISQKIVFLQLVSVIEEDEFIWLHI